MYLVSGAAGTPDVPTPPQTRSVSPASAIIPPHPPPHLPLAGMPSPTHLWVLVLPFDTITHFTPMSSRKPSNGHFLLALKYTSDAPL